MKKITVLLCLILASFYFLNLPSPSSYAADLPSAILVASSEQVRAKAKAVLKDYFTFSDTLLEINYALGNIKTAEGDVFPLKSVFTKQAISGSGIQRALSEQQMAETLIAVWPEEKKRELNKAWGLTEVEVTIYAAFFDLASGRLIYLSERQGRNSNLDPDKAFQDAVYANLAKDMATASQIVTAKLKTKTPEAIRVVIQIDNMKEDEFLAKGQELIKLIGGLNGVTALKDAYSASDYRLTLRVNYAGRQQDFYLTLYKNLQDNPNYDKYAVSPPSGYTIRIARLEPFQKKLILVNVPQDRYHDREETIEGVLKTVGATNIDWQYIMGDVTYNSSIEFTFEHSEATERLEKMVWAEAQKQQNLQNIKLVRVSNNNIVYEAPYRAGDWISLELVFNNISTENYRQIGAELDKIVKGLEGLKNLQKAYKQELFCLSYTFEAKKSALEIDTILWQKIEDQEKLKDIAQDNTSDKVISYFYRTASESLDLGKNEVSIYLDKVSGQRYNLLAPAFKKMLLQIEGVSGAVYSYNFQTKTIIFRVTLTDKTIADLDEQIAKLCSKDELFKYISRGPSSAYKLVYYYYGKDLAPEIKEEEIATATSSATKENSDAMQIIANTDPAVVIVYISTTEGSGHGSGFFVNPRGYILTNNHVVRDATRIIIQTYSGSRYEAQVITTDATLDLALLKVKSPSQDFPALSIGKSADLKKGQAVIVIGTPLSDEYENSVVTGVISGFDRLQGWIQISASIFPGNSGGPVLDSSGKVIGIAKAVAVSNETVPLKRDEQTVTVEMPQRHSNIGLVIPIDYAANILNLAK